MLTVGIGPDAVEFPYDGPGIKAAEKYAQAVGQTVNYAEKPAMQQSNITLGYKEGGKIPSNDATIRSKKEYLGGGVVPDMLYKKGGKTK